MQKVMGRQVKEIVGAKIGTLITNDRRTIAEAVERNAVIEFLDRERMQFMAAMDLGRNWELIASGPTLFCIDADGQPQPSNAVVQADSRGLMREVAPRTES